ncbi:tetratricopeptide repeat protein [Sinimarinibacterium flocculans]|uniref:tetratricopeptide repeat protein n=1 Tax=Sinimarinibacterium flocculans TaxID=985250 RepID=UPI0035120804
MSPTLSALRAVQQPRPSSPGPCEPPPALREPRKRWPLLAIVALAPAALAWHLTGTDMPQPAAPSAPAVLPAPTMTPEPMDVARKPSPEPQAADRAPTPVAASNAAPAATTPAGPSPAMRTTGADTSTVRDDDAADLLRRLTAMGHAYDDNVGSAPVERVLAMAAAAGLDVERGQHADGRRWIRIGDGSVPEPSASPVSRPTPRPSATPAPTPAPRRTTPAAPPVQASGFISPSTATRIVKRSAMNATSSSAAAPMPGTSEEASDRRAALRAAEAQLRAGQRDAAQAALAAALARWPDDPAPRQMLAHSLLTAGQADRAVAVLATLAPSIEDWPHYYALLAQGYARLEYHERAVGIYRLLVDRFPRASRYWYALAMAHDARRDANAARQALLRVAALADDDAQLARMAREALARRAASGERG